MMVTILIMIISALLIYFSCEFFVNGVEWVGKAFNISQSAVGSILAAFGTALPESIVTFIAVVFGTNSKQKDIGVGAALGGPLVLSTIAYAIIGITIFIFSNKRKSGEQVKYDNKKLARDQEWFMCIFVFKIALGLVAFTIKPWLGILFLAAYGVYFYKEMNVKNPEVAQKLEPLKITPNNEEPKKLFILIQTIGALVVIFTGSQMFVNKLDILSNSLGIAPHMVSLLLSPVATELPEILNAVIWVKQGKESLALSNVSGSMMIQATVPSALGIMFTPWLFDKYLIISAVITFIAIFSLWVTLRKKRLSDKRLACNILLYVLFVIVVVFAKN
ncbi:sodium:calcium antiporter [Clostridium sp. MT-14]|uniref:sodium:calcium antiporter n=1 Tax=Clostridium sp. MT-14 TaxID=3348360 RepID=UPI0035F34618